MRPAAALTVLSCLLLLGGCGGSGEGSSASTTEPGGGSTLEQLWREPGDDVAVIPGTENHEPGAVRVSFLVADAKGQLVTLPTAKVFVADALDQPPSSRPRRSSSGSAFPAATRPTRATSTSRR